MQSDTKNRTTKCLLILEGNAFSHPHLLSINTKASLKKCAHNYKQVAIFEDGECIAVTGFDGVKLGAENI
jgi:hypothetical protein